MGRTEINLIAKRRADIEAQRLTLKVQLEQLDAAERALADEEQELAIAERVIGRLQAGAGSFAANVVVKDAIDPTSIKIPKMGTKRPANIPTTRDMVATLLKEAIKDGKIGLDSRDLMLKIHARWWPGVGRNQILPEVHRFVGKGQILRRGPLFVLPPTHAGGLFTEEAAE